MMHSVLKDHNIDSERATILDKEEGAIILDKENHNYRIELKHALKIAGHVFNSFKINVGLFRFKL